MSIDALRNGGFEKVFRDPVYGNISVFHPVVREVVDAPEFQRLRRIHQLGMCHTVYYGAEHSRFQHSMGAMWLMHRVLRHWRDSKGIDLPPHLAVAATLAALLHDVGHGPFSHALENVFARVHHEEIGNRIVAERLRPLLERHGVDTDLVLGIMRGTAGMPYLSELISSQVDVDRMDYLLRDSLYTGVRYGVYDIDRMVSVLTPIPDVQAGDGSMILALDAKGIHVAEEYLFSRYSMYWQVYFHKTTRSCEVLLKSVLRRARDLWAEAPRALYIPPNLAFMFEPREQRSPQEWLEAFVGIDDADLYHAIKLWRGADDPVLRDLADRFLNRRLFKALPAPADPETREAVRSLVVATVGAAAAPYYCHLDRHSDTAYDYYITGRGRSAIRVVTHPPAGWEEVSEVTQTRAVQALGQVVSRAWLFIPETCVDRARQIVAAPRDEAIQMSFLQAEGG